MTNKTVRPKKKGEWEFDFIVIGSGVAGLMSALYACKKGTVLVITKKKIADCNTYYAQGGIAAVTGQGDSFVKHVKDTLEAGHYLNDRKAVEYIVKKGPAAVNRLAKWGVKFDVDKKGEFDLKLEGGHSANRILHYKDQIGVSIEKALIKQIRKNKKITVWENSFAKDLIITEENGKTRRNKEIKKCIGIEVIRKNKLINVFGKRTVLAAGGVGQVYLKTTNPQIATGDAIAMAHRAGGLITNMQYIQFHPTALDLNTNPLFLLSETLRGEGAKLINEKGVRFMQNAHPLAELAPRDIVTQEMIKHKKTYLDLRGISPKTLKTKYPTILAKIRDSGKNPKKEPIPVSPVAHYLCGGIKTDLKGRTNIKELYAIGECADTGLHGANRLASNSLLEATVMSSRITTPPLPTSTPKIPYTKPTPPIKSPSLPTLKKYRLQIQTAMWNGAGITRTAKSLQKAKKELQNIQTKLNPKANTPENLEIINMLTTGLLIITDAEGHHPKKQTTL